MCAVAMQALTNIKRKDPFISKLHSKLKDIKGNRLTVGKEQIDVNEMVIHG